MSESHFKSTSTDNHVTKTNWQRTVLFSDNFPRTLLRERPLKQLLYSCQAIKQTQYNNFKGKFNHGFCYILNRSTACIISFLIIVFILTYLQYMLLCTYFSISSHSLRNSIDSEKHPRDFSSYSSNTLIQHWIKLEIYVIYEHNNVDTCLT